MAQEVSNINKDQHAQHQAENMRDNSAIHRTLASRTTKQLESWESIGTSKYNQLQLKEGIRIPFAKYIPAFNFGSSIV